jgi:photosystem II stability/assembly factor-like uncharacterized protein
VAVGEGNRGTILTSPDGVTWTARDSKTFTGLHFNDLYGITYGNNQFVAVGWNGTIRTSPNGTTWMVRTSDTSSPLRAVTYGGGQFVAVGDAGTILTSP